MTFGCICPLPLLLQSFHLSFLTTFLRHFDSSMLHKATFQVVHVPKLCNVAIVPKCTTLQFSSMMAVALDVQSMEFRLHCFVFIHVRRPYRVQREKTFLATSQFGSFEIECLFDFVFCGRDLFQSLGLRPNVHRCMGAMRNPKVWITSDRRPFLQRGC